MRVRRNTAHQQQFQKERRRPPSHILPKNRGPEITYTIKKNEMTVQSTPIDEDRLLASLRL